MAEDEMMYEDEAESEVIRKTEAFHMCLNLAQIDLIYLNPV